MSQSHRTRTIWMSLAILVLLVCGVTKLLARPATRVDPIEVDPRVSLDERMKIDANNDSVFSPNTLCASCHMDLFDQWTKSMHYQSWREPVFQAIYANYQRYMASDEQYLTPEDIDLQSLQGRELRRERFRRNHESDASSTDIPIFNIPKSDTQIGPMTHGDGLMKEGIYDGKIHMNCMRCHAPGADFLKDKDLYLENDIDGVFCDYCHTVIDYTQTEGYILYWSSIKQGPRMFGTTSSHAIEYNRLSEESRFCRGCHEYSNPWGVKIYNTYDEWYKSDYANPASTVNCQECHMKTYKGRASLRGDIRPDVHSHAIGGGHDYNFMVGSADVEFTTDVQGSDLYIDVDVANNKAGHNYPSSNGMRQLVLVVRLKGSSGETLWEGSRTYERVFGDCDGNPTYDPWRITQVLSDTTLTAGETRKESFVTPMPETDDNLYVTAQLFYRITPEGADIDTLYQPSPFRVDFSTQFIQ
jgi:hypothetical protein